MTHYRNQYDVSQTVDVTNPSAVRTEINWIFLGLYPSVQMPTIDRAFEDVNALYHGRFPGYHACDTAYHNLQHVLDVTLAMARLMAGYEHGNAGSQALGHPLFSLGVIAALFHDCGYVRTLDDTGHHNGGEWKQTRSSRSGTFLRNYLPRIGLGHMADIAAALVHFTGYELAAAHIEVPSLRYRLLGSLLGSADIIAQMSDRCYLEKCRDRLYPEFVAGGIARKSQADGEQQIVFKSGDDVVMKTPGFYVGAMRRLKNDLGNCYHYAVHVFDGKDLYLKSIRRNIRFAQFIKQKNDTSVLRRVAPCLNRPQRCARCK